MLVKVKCGNCGVSLSAPAEKAGQKCKCPKCAAAIQIPNLPAAENSWPPGAGPRNPAAPASQPGPAKSPAPTSPSAAPGVNTPMPRAVNPTAKAAPTSVPVAKKPAPPPTSAANIDLDDLGPSSDLSSLDLASSAFGSGASSPTLGSMNSMPMSGQYPNALGIGTGQKSGGVEPWVWGVIGGGAAIILLLVGLVIGLTSGGSSTPQVAAVTAPSVLPTAPSAAPPAPSGPVAPAPVAPAVVPQPVPVASVPTLTPGPQPISAGRIGPAPPVVATDPMMGKSGGASGTAPPRNGPMSTADVIESVQNGIVLITVEDETGKPVSLGTGFVVDATGIVATNFHVMEDAHQAKAQFHDGQIFEIGGFHGYDKARDLALVKLNAFPKNMRVLPLQVSEMPRVGSDVIAIGHPSGFKFTVTTGIVSSVQKTSDLPEGVRDSLTAPADNVWIQTNAAISGGNSGGPLLNMQGEVLGINSWIYAANGQTLGFATHIQNLAVLQSKTQNAAEVIPLAQVRSESGPKNFLANLDPDISKAFEEFKANLTSFEQEVKQLMTQGSTRTQFTQLYATKNPIPIFSKRMMEVAAAKRKTKVAFQALAIVCSLVELPNAYPTGTFKKASDILVEDHVSEPELGLLMMALIESDDKNAHDLMKRVLDASPEKSVKGMACLARAMAIHNNEKTRSKTEEESIALLDRVLREFADVKYEKSTLGALARPVLVEIKYLAIGKEAPEIIGKDINGDEFKLSDYRGKVVVVDFFADWCPYCVKMYPEERGLIESLKDKPFAIVGVNVDNKDRLKRIIDTQKVTWKCWSDGPKGPIASGWNVSSFPSIYVLDQQGIVRYKFEGAPGPALAQAINKLLGGNKADANELVANVAGGDVNSQFDALDKASDTQPMNAIVGAAMILAHDSRSKTTKKHLSMIEEWINKGLADDPESYFFQVSLARLRILQDKPFDAIAGYRKLLEREDVENDDKAVVKNGLAYLLATCSVKKKDWEEALVLIDDAMRVARPNAAMLDTRGMVHLALGNVQNALRDLHTAAAEKPNGVIYFHIAQAEAEAKNQQAAVAALQNAFSHGLDREELVLQEQKKLDALLKALKVRVVK